MKRNYIQATLKRLHWLPIYYIVTYKVEILTYTIRFSGEHMNMNSLATDYLQTWSLLSADEHLLAEQPTKLSCTSRTFCVAALKLWKTLQ